MQQCFISSYTLRAFTQPVANLLWCTTLLIWNRWKGLFLHSIATFKQVKVIKSSCLVKGQCKSILVVKSQSKYLAGQHFDWGQRSEYRIYWSTTCLQRYHAKITQLFFQSYCVMMSNALKPISGCKFSTAKIFQMLSPPWSPVISERPPMHIK